MRSVLRTAIALLALAHALRRSALESAAQLRARGPEPTPAPPPAANCAELLDKALHPWERKGLINKATAAWGWVKSGAGALIFRGLSSLGWEVGPSPDADRWRLFSASTRLPWPEEKVLPSCVEHKLEELQRNGDKLNDRLFYVLEGLAFSADAVHHLHERAKKILNIWRRFDERGPVVHFSLAEIDYELTRGSSEPERSELQREVIRYMRRASELNSGASTRMPMQSTLRRSSLRAFKKLEECRLQPIREEIQDLPPGNATRTALERSVFETELAFVAELFNHMSKREQECARGLMGLTQDLALFCEQFRFLHAYDVSSCSELEEVFHSKPNGDEEEKIGNSEAFQKVLADLDNCKKRLARLAQKDAEHDRRHAAAAQEREELAHRDAEHDQRHADAAREREELVQKDAELAQKDAEHDQRHADAAREREELEKKDAELAQKDAEHDQRDKEHDDELADAAQEREELEAENRRQDAQADAATVERQTLQEHNERQDASIADAARRIDDMSAVLTEMGGDYAARALEAKKALGCEDAAQCPREITAFVSAARAELTILWHTVLSAEADGPSAPALRLLPLAGFGGELSTEWIAQEQAQRRAALARKLRSQQDFENLSKTFAWQAAAREEALVMQGVRPEAQWDALEDFALRLDSVMSWSLQEIREGLGLQDKPTPQAQLGVLYAHRAFEALEQLSGGVSVDTTGDLVDSAREPQLPQNARAVLLATPGVVLAALMVS